MISQVWLMLFVLMAGDTPDGHTDKIEMKSLEACQAEATAWLNNPPPKAKDAIGLAATCGIEFSAGDP